MADSIGVGGVLNDLEGRIAMLEQRAPRNETPMVEVTLDANGSPVQANPLDYTVGAWEPYPKLVTTGSDDTVSSSWNDGVEGLLTPTAVRMGNLIVLSGVIKRAASTSVAITANTNQPDPGNRMVKLPDGWRPSRTVILICPCAGASSVGPEATATMGQAMLSVKPDLMQNAGIVRLITATVGLSAGANGGWISLCGAFPGMFTANAPNEILPGSWDAAPPGQTWDQVDPLVTWDSWPNQAGG